MPARKDKKSRKRKHEQIQQPSENEASTSPTPKPKRRKISSKSPKKKHTKKTNKTPKKSPRKVLKKSKSRKSPKKSQTQNDSENESQIQGRTTRHTQKNKKIAKKNSSKQEKSDDSQSDSSSSDNGSEYDPNNSHKKRKQNLQRKRITVTPKHTKNKNKNKKRRVSVSQTQTQSQRIRRTQSQSQTHDSEEENEFVLVQHNERVMEMYNWLIGNQSWASIKNTLKGWVELESDSDDTENYSQLTVDIINLMLYCGGIRVLKLEDIEDCDITSLSTKEKKKFIQKLQRALLVDHEDIESIPESDSEDSPNEARDSEEEKAEEANNNHNRQKKTRKRRKKGQKARTNAEKVLTKDPMLWMNGTQAKQKSFENRYRQLWERIGAVFELAIFESDDFIITMVLHWCQFLSRQSSFKQLRKLGVVTAFALCDPFIKCIARNRKAMEKQRDILEREQMSKKNRSPKRKRKGKKGTKDSDKIKDLKANIEEYKTKISNMESHTNDMFDQIAAYKASDCKEGIRCLVLTHIVKWINMDPSTDSFLRQRYWQYLWYGVQDKVSSKVRICALTALMELFDYRHTFHGNKRYRKKANKGKTGDKIVQESDTLDETRKSVLEPFWDIINADVHGLLKDKNESVVKHAVEFINILLRGDMLGADDGDCILNYIFDESDVIRQVSADFIFHDTFDDQAVLKAHESSNVNDENESNEGREEEKQEAKVRIKDIHKMKDDIIEIIQLMKDRVVDLNLRVNQLLSTEKQRSNANNNNDSSAALMKENALYRNYVQVSDYIVQSMSHRLAVLKEWNILFEILRDADANEQRQKERNLNTNNNSSEDGIENMNVKHYIDDEGQTILCYLILSCVKSVNSQLDIECRNVKAKRGRKSKETESEQRQLALDKLKQCILPHLASLLDTFQADVFKLYPLIQIIPLIPIDAFNSVKAKAHLNEILNALKVIFMRHDTPFISHKLFDGSDSDSEISEEMKTLEITDEMDSQEREEIELKIRKKELKELKKCIKESIDSELIDMIGKAFAYFCNSEYQYRDHSGHFIFGIVSEITDGFDEIYTKLDSKLSKGEDMSTMDGLMSSDQSCLQIMQSLFSNVHKQCAFKSSMDVGTISFTNHIQSLLSNVYDKHIFDGHKYELSSMLLKFLSIEIGHNSATKLNRASPDIEKLHELTQQKQCLAKLLSYYVNIVYDGVIAKTRELSWAETLVVLDRILTVMDGLCFFRRFTNQSALLHTTFNNASLIEMEPISSVDSQSINDIAVLKQRLLSVCTYVFTLPMIEDPYDPSSHVTTENIQIRYLICCARLAIMNSEYYKRFGAEIISYYHAPHIKDTRRDALIKQIIHKLYDKSHDRFEEMLFEACVMIMDRETMSVEIRKHCMGRICKSVSMFEGLSRRNRKYWLVFGKLFIDYIIGKPHNIPKYFTYLHALTIFLKTFTNRDKLELWTYFRSLSRKLPSEDQRSDSDSAQWELYAQFRTKLKTEAMKAQRNRNMNLDNDDLENIDLSQPSQSQSQIQSQIRDGVQDISMGVHVSAIRDIEDTDNKESEIIENNTETNDGNESDKSETNNENENVRVSVARSKNRNTNTNDNNARVSVAQKQSREDRKEEENVSESEESNNRVSVSLPSKGKGRDKEEVEDEDVDMRDKQETNEENSESESESETDNNTTHTSTTQQSSSPRRGGLGRKRKQTSQVSTKGRSSGKWLKKKRNRNK